MFPFIMSFISFFFSFSAFLLVYQPGLLVGKKGKKEKLTLASLKQQQQIIYLSILDRSQNPWEGKRHKFRVNIVATFK